MAMLNNQMVIIVEPNVMGDKTTNYAVGLQTSHLNLFSEHCKHSCGMTIPPIESS